MRTSIRTFLLINLLLSVTLITSLAIIGNLFLAHKDIQTQLDAQLMRTTIQLDAFLSVPLTSDNFTTIQQTLNSTDQQKIYSGMITPQEQQALDAQNEANHTLEFQISKVNYSSTHQAPRPHRYPMAEWGCQHCG